MVLAWEVGTPLVHCNTGACVGMAFRIAASMTALPVGDGAFERLATLMVAAIGKSLGVIFWPTQQWLAVKVSGVGASPTLSRAVCNASDTLL